MGHRLRAPGHVAFQCGLSHSPPTVLTRLFRNEAHTVHACENRLCPISCQLCKRLCRGDHLHGLSSGVNHLCGCAYSFLPCTILFNRTSSEEHVCSALCSADGICQIDTTPQSIEATLTGRHKAFQYTKVRGCLSKRVIVIDSGNQFTQSASLNTLRYPPNVMLYQLPSASPALK